ncbi:hypothetical protein [Streptomyces sp. NPDC092295]|uniref:hypothetical protein n=1 Tax=Streptomyces sp. NPDC092295 TaxID=3366011 RepID=UPI00380C2D6B
MGRDPEQAHQPDRVGGFPGLVEEPVLSELGGVDADSVAERFEVGDADRGPVDMQGGDGADDQVGVGAQRPPLVALDQPVLDELQCEVVEVGLVVEPVRSADSQAPGGAVEVVEPDLGDLLGTDGVDSHQDESELVLDAGDLVQEPFEPVRRDGPGNPDGRGQVHVPGRVTEDPALGSQGSEERPQPGEVGVVDGGRLHPPLGDFVE